MRKNVVVKLGIPILAVRSLKSDFVYPNATGYRMMAESLAALLKKSRALQ